ncbi:MAG: polyferredoxin heterodixulfide reductase subunit A [Gallionellaceae bacterium]|nr:MAG: polyferredoxin heterodixulfide reductase subunit A [Gallionellaceae bacterium]
MSKKRTGVFVCHCGTNIAATVDVGRVAKEMAAEHTVAFTQEYVYMCSEPGQESVVQAIKDNKLDSIVVTCCSPNLHEKTFRDNAQRAGINNFTCEIANIREQCSWVHADKAKGTEKAIKISRSVVRRVNRNLPMDSVKVPVTRRAMVIGGGIAGIQAALDIANAGIEVVLVEKQATIGGRMLQLSETFPTLDCSQCVLSPKMVEVNRHPGIKLMTYSEVQEVAGSVGNFRVKVHKRSSFVDPDKCKICDHCTEVCPVVVPNEYELGLTARRAIYIPYAQAIPASFTLDEDACLGLNPIRCGKCKDVCEAGAIDYDMRPVTTTEEVGAIVVATGFDLYGPENMPELGGGKVEDVLDGLQFERLISASGATKGHILRPSDLKEPKEVVWARLYFLY